MPRTDKKVVSAINLRRDIINNYASHVNFKPQKGEICIVDPTATSPWSTAKAIRVKIGDGVKTWSELDYIDNLSSSILVGYYNNGKFYYDAAHTKDVEAVDEEDEKSALNLGKMLFVDLHSGAIYYYDVNEEQFKANTVAIPDASATQAGVLKLYQKLGQNTDGTMSQKAITDAIDSIRLVVDGNEGFSLSNLVDTESEN